MSILDINNSSVTSKNLLFLMSENVFLISILFQISKMAFLPVTITCMISEI